MTKEEVNNLWDIYQIQSNATIPIPSSAIHFFAITLLTDQSEPFCPNSIKLSDSHNGSWYWITISLWIVTFRFSKWCLIPCCSYESHLFLPLLLIWWANFGFNFISSKYHLLPSWETHRLYCMPGWTNWQTIKYSKTGWKLGVWFSQDNNAREGLHLFNPTNSYSLLWSGEI